MQTVLKQAYQAEVLLHKVHMITVGTRWPHKDHVVLTTENTYQHPDYELFTYTQRIDVVIPCENRLEAIKLNKALKEYLVVNEMMLPLHVGVFQKPYLKDNQKARKYYAYAIDNAKTFLNLLPELQKNKQNKYVVGATPVESNVIVNGFDLTYQIEDYRMEHFFMEKDFDDKPLDKPFYRLSLYTSSIFENEDIKSKDKELVQTEELLIFHIKGDSESEIIALGTALAKQLREKKQVFTCKGAFPKKENDFYAVSLGKSASELLKQLSSVDTKKALDR